MSDINQFAQIDVNINGEQAKNEINDLKNKAKELRDKISDLHKESKDTGKELASDIKAAQKEYQQMQKKIKELQTTTVNLNEALEKIDKLTPKELQKTIRAITGEMNSGRVKRGTEEWNNLTAALRRVKEEASKVKEEMSEARSLSDRFSDWGNKWMGIVMTIDGGLQAISGMKSTMQDSVQAYADMQEAESQVIKYTEMTKKEVEDLNEEFKKMDTRTPRERLNALAGDAGRLGITSRDAVLEFVDAADKINVALGEDLGEDAVKNIGKLAQMFGEDKTKGLRGAMLATGSAINEVAQNSSAAEAYLVDFTARVAGAAKQANISQADIIGYASVLDENMLRDETAATAFQNIMLKMFQKPELFAKIARINTAEFTKTMKEDANKAMLQFIESLSARGNLAELAPIFENMKLDGQGAASVLAVMAGKLDDIRDRQALANKAYEEATSIINEYNVQNNTVQAGLDKNIKKFNDLKIELGEKLLPLMRSGISLTSLSLELLKTIIDFSIEHRATIISTTTAIALYTAAVNRSVIADKLKVFWTNSIVASTQKLWLTLKANPWGAVIAVIGIAIGALVDYRRKTSEANEATQKMTDIRSSAITRMNEEKNKIEQLIKVAKDESAALDIRQKAINKLNEIVPNYNAHLDNTTGAYRANKVALDQYLSSLKRQYEIEGAKDQLKELGSQKAQLMTQKAITEEKLKQAKANAKIANQYGGVTGMGSVAGSSNISSLTTGEVLRRRQNELDEIDKKLKSISETESAIGKAYGEDIVIADMNQDNDSGNGNGGGGGLGEDLKEEQLRRKRINQINELSRKLRLETRLQYSSGILDYQAYQDRIYQIDQDNINQRLALYQDYESEYGTIQNELQKLDEDRQKAKNSWSLEQIEQETQAQRSALEVKHASGSMSERTYQDELDRIELEGLKRRAEYQRKWAIPEDANQAEEQYQKALQDKKTARQVQFLQQVKQMQDKYLKSSAEEQMQFQLDTLDQMHRAGLLAEEDYQRMLAIIRAQGSQSIKSEADSKTSQILTDAGYKAPEATGTNDPLSSAIISMGQWVSTQKQNEAALQKIREMEEAGVITHQEAANAIAEIDKNRFESYVAAAQAAYGVVNALMSAAGDYIRASMDAEVSAIEERYDAEIERAGNNSTQVAKLEDKKEAEIAKVKNKYNKKAMVIEISQAVASTAMAAINAYASAAAVPVVGYILAPIAAAAALAAGALQIATIKKQHEAQSKGYYTGGFTGKGPRRQVAGTVHAGEFVVNADGVNNPNVRPLLHFLDLAQRNNTIGSLTAADISRVVTAPVISSREAPNDTQQSVVISQDPQTKNLLDKLYKKLDEPITANVVIEGEDGFDSQYNKYLKLKNRK